MTARYRVPSRVGVVDGDDLVYLAQLPDGPISVLDGISAVLWQLAIEDAGGEQTDVADLAAHLTGTEAADIRADVHAFLDELVARGLLVPAVEQASDLP